MTDSTSKPAENFDFAVDDVSIVDSEDRKSSYSLLLLFYLTTVAAFLVAVCRLAFVDTKWTAQTMFVGGMVASGACVVSAVFIGYFLGRTWLSTLMGLFAGLICGLVGMLLTLVQPTHYETASYIICAGCWFMSLLAIVFNRTKN